MTVLKWSPMYRDKRTHTNTALSTSPFSTWSKIRSMRVSGSSMEMLGKLAFYLFQLVGDCLTYMLEMVSERLVLLLRLPRQLRRFAAARMTLGFVSQMLDRP